MATHPRMITYCTFFFVSLKNYSYNFIIFPFVWLRKIRSGNSKNNAVIELLFYIIQLYFFYWLLCVLHTETYVFQSTQLADFLRPVKRSECNYAVHSLDDFNGDGKKRNLLLSRLVKNKKISLVSDINVEKVKERENKDEDEDEDDMKKKKYKKKKLSIGVLYLYDGSPSGGNGNDGGESWSEPLMSRVISNRKKYCDRHGYRLINANHLIDRTRPAAWSKLKAIDHYLSIKNDFEDGIEGSLNSSTYNESQVKGAVTYDYMLYIDMDVIIMNFEVRLEDFILAVNTKNGDSSTTFPEFIMTEDWKGYKYIHFDVHICDDVCVLFDLREILLLYHYLSSLLNDSNRHISCYRIFSFTPALFVF